MGYICLHGCLILVANGATVHIQCVDCLDYIQRLDLWNIHRHFPLNVATFHLMEVDNPYMEHLGYKSTTIGIVSVNKFNKNHVNGSFLFGEDPRI